MNFHLISPLEDDRSKKKGLFSKKKVTSIVTKNRLELRSKHLYPFRVGEYPTKTRLIARVQVCLFVCVHGQK